MKKKESKVKHPTTPYKLWCERCQKSVELTPQGIAKHFNAKNKLCPTSGMSMMDMMNNWEVADE